MDAAELRELQAPLRQKYQDDPATARTPLHATADFSAHGVTATVSGWAGPVRAGLHEATGGDGSDACSGDMLLEALLACAGVTLRSVATAMELDVRSARRCPPTGSSTPAARSASTGPCRSGSATSW